MIQNDQFIGAVAHSSGNIVDGTIRSRDFAFYLSMQDHKFRLLMDREDLRLAYGTTTQVDISFDSGETFHVVGQVVYRQVKVLLADDDVALWTHAFTSASVMIITLPGSSYRWSYDLTGTTPVVASMAAAILRAGIRRLPGPWSINRYYPEIASTPTLPPPASKSDNEAKRLDLELARADVERAKAEADRARADAEKARADAERVKAQARISYDERRRADEAAQDAASRAAEQARQSKAESDARGVEP